MELTVFPAVFTANAGAAAGMLLLQTLGLGNYDVFGSVVTTCSIAPAWITGPSGEMVHDVKARALALRPCPVSNVDSTNPPHASGCLQWWYGVPRCHHGQPPITYDAVKLAFGPVDRSLTHASTEATCCRHSSIGLRCPLRCSWSSCGARAQRPSACARPF